MQAISGFYVTISMQEMCQKCMRYNADIAWYLGELSNTLWILTHNLDMSVNQSPFVAPGTLLDIMKVSKLVFSKCAFYVP